jgi:hypothetical protein
MASMLLSDELCGLMSPHGRRTVQKLGFELVNIEKKLFFCTTRFVNYVEYSCAQNLWDTRGA